MKQEKQQQEPVKAPSTVRTSTMWMAILVAFIAGIVVNGMFFGQGDNTPPASIHNPHAAHSGTPSAEAQRLFSMARQHSSDAQGWTDLGNYHFDRGEHAEAIAAYKKSLELDSTNADVWTDMGIMCRKVGLYNEAVRVFNHAAKVSPTHEKSLFNKGIVLHHDLKDTKGAIAAWEELLRRNPNALSPNGEPIRQLLDVLRSNLE